MAEPEDLLHRRTAEVEIAVLEAQLFVGLGPLDLERRRRRGVKTSSALAADLIAPVLSLGLSLPVRRGATTPGRQ